jgi:hypothetical protein
MYTSINETSIFIIHSRDSSIFTIAMKKDVGKKLTRKIHFELDI